MKSPQSPFGPGGMKSGSRTSAPTQTRVSVTAGSGGVPKCYRTRVRVAMQLGELWAADLRRPWPQLSGGSHPAPAGGSPSGSDCDAPPTPGMGVRLPPPHPWAQVTGAKSPGVSQGLSGGASLGVAFGLSVLPPGTLPVQATPEPR